MGCLAVSPRFAHKKYFFERVREEHAIKTLTVLNVDQFQKLIKQLVFQVLNDHIKHEFYPYI